MSRDLLSKPETSLSLYRRLAQNVGYLAGGTGAAALLNMLALAFNARSLSPERFGLLVLLQTSALAMRGLISFGTQQPVIQLGSAAFASQDNKRLGQIIGLGLSFDFLAASLSSLVAFLILFFASGLIGLEGRDYEFAAIFAAALLLMGYLTSNGVFRLLNRFDLLGLIEAGSAALILAASAVFYFIEAQFAAYVWMFATIMCLNFQAQLWTSLYLIRKKGVRVSFAYGSMAKSDIRQFITYCWSTWGTTAVESMRTHGDSLLVSAMVSVEGVGIYNVAKQSAGVLRKITAIYASAVYPEVSILAAHGNILGADRLKRRMVAIGGALGACFVLAVAFFGYPFLEIAFGPRFAAAYVALILLTFAAALQLIGHTLAVYVQVFISPASLFWIYLMALAMYALVAPVGVMLFGLNGAALGQVLFTASVIALSSLVLSRASLRRAGEARP